MALCPNDSSFGPVADCRPFDITFGFSVLIFLPNALFVLFGAVRFILFAWKPTRSYPTLKTSRLVLAAAWIISSGLAAIFWTRSMHFQPKEAIWQGALALIFQLLASIVGSAHSSVEQLKSRRPSLMLAVYCLLSLMTEAVLLRSLVLSGLSRSMKPFFYTFVAIYASKSGILFVGNWRRQRSYPGLKREESGGLFKRALMLYMLPIFRTGLKGQLTQEALTLGHGLPRSETLYGIFEASFAREASERRSRPLLRALWKALHRELLSPILPCLLMAAFQIALPFIGRDLLRFVDDSPSMGELSPNIYGWGLVGAQLFAALGFALSLTWFLRATMRGAAAVRCVLLQAVYHKSLITSNDHDRLNLHADVQAICEYLHAWHLQWQCLFLVALFPLLFWQVLAHRSFLTLAIALLVLFSRPWSAKSLMRSQYMLMRLIKRRLDLSESFLRASARLRALSALDVTLRQLRGLRQAELAALIKCGQRQVCALAASAAGDVSVYLTAIIPYLLMHRATSVDGPVLWSLLIYIELIAQPLFSLAGLTVRHLVPAWLSFGRIEAFLLADAPESLAVGWHDHLSSIDLPPHKWTTAIGDRTTRSHLVQTVLQGTRFVATPVAYISARPAFFEDEILRENVDILKTGSHKRYVQAMWFAGLAAANARSTPATLSSGQRVQLAFARAIFANAKTVIIDEALDALDTETAAMLLDNLIGDTGLWRGKTILLVSSLLHSPLADHIILCEPHGAFVQGCASDMTAYLSQTVPIAERYTFRDMRPFKFASKLAAPELPSKTATFEYKMVADDQRPFTASSQPTFEILRRFLYASGLRTCVCAFCLILAVALVVWLIPVLLASLYIALGPSTTLEFVAYWIAFYVVYLASASAFAMLASRRQPLSSAGMYHDSVVRLVLQSGSLSKDAAMALLASDLPIADGPLTMALSAFVLNVLGVVANIIFACLPARWLIAAFALALGLLYSIDRLTEQAVRVLRRLDEEMSAKLQHEITRIQDAEWLRYLSAMRMEAYSCWQHTQSVERSQQAFFLHRSAQIFFVLCASVTLGLVSCLLFSFAVLWRRYVWTTTLGSAVFTMNRLLTDAVFLYQSLVQLRIACFHLGKVQQAAKAESESQQNQEPWTLEKGSIRFCDVSLRPIHGQDVLDSVDISIRAGERFGIFGPAGGGKSAMLSAISRLVELDRGHVTIDGRDVQTILPSVLRQSITFISQNLDLLDLSIRDNIDLEGLHADRDIWAALDVVGARSFVESLPERLDAPCGRIHVSTEQRQLLLLAQIILRNRQLLILDNALWATDEATEQALWKGRFADYLLGVTTVLVTSRFDTLMSCDRVLYLQDGRVAEIGVPSALVSNKESALYRLGRLSGRVR